MWVATRPADGFAVAAISIAELWHGVERGIGVHRSKRKQYLVSFRAVEVDELDLTGSDLPELNQSHIHGIAVE